MKDPPRLLDEGADAFERSLLNAASEDIGSERLLKKTLAAAGIVSIGAAATTAAGKAAAATAATSSGAGAAGAAAKAEALLLLKWILGGALAGLTTIGVYTQVTDMPPRPVTTAAASVPALYNDGAQRPGAATADPALQSGAAAPRRAEGAGEPRTPEIAPSPAPAPPAAAAPEIQGVSAASAAKGATAKAIEAGGEHTSPAMPSRTSALTAEVASLDRVRRAIRAGDGAQALRELEVHRAAFPAGVLGPEATVLRIEALLLSGQRGAAQALTEQLLQNPANAAHATRVESLLRRPSNP